MLMEQKIYLQKNKYSVVRVLFGGVSDLFNRISSKVVLDRLRIVCENPDFGLGSR